MRHRRIPLHFFPGSSRQCKAEDGTLHVCSPTSHGRNLCTSPAQLCFPCADHGERQAAFLEVQSFEEPELGSHWWRATTFFEDNQSQQIFNWLFQQTCYCLCFSTWCKCPTPSLCPGVILDPIPFLLLAHRLSCLN